MKLTTAEKLAFQSLAERGQVINTRLNEVSAQKRAHDQDVEDFLSELEDKHGLPTGSMKTTHGIDLRAGAIVPLSEA